MKKLLLVFSAFIAISCNAQIANGSFENWAQDTFYLAAGEITGLPADTTYYQDPVEWTSSNAISDLDSLGSLTLVTQSNDATYGSSAIQMVTDSISLPQNIGGTSFSVKLTLPGFALNGKFPINPQSLILSGVSTISPASVLGAGQPIAERLADIKGYYKYTPVFNPNTNANDTCLIWAMLRRGQEVVANAIFKSTTATSGYASFQIPFNYVSCDMPDTLVILMASSVPNVQTILGGTSGLIPGSVLLVDTISYDVVPNNFMFPPFANADNASTVKNTPVTINVLANDTDCDGLSLTVSVIRNPSNGTATVQSNQILYTPNTDFVGLDTLWYKDTNTNSDTAAAWVRIVVNPTSGISSTNLVDVRVYPVPANNTLNIQFDNKGKTYARIYDIIGNEVQNATLTNNFNTINISNLANGLYGLQLVNEQGTVIARAKFTVAK
ncbi:MAG TPA: T9SS type A sorting domain-containing protein [Chitinophagales bacterium]|nr:T9SS type A sorting domain-containing protein [Chitinophagales bacterium]